MKFRDLLEKDTLLKDVQKILKKKSGTIINIDSEGSRGTRAVLIKIDNDKQKDDLKQNGFAITPVSDKYAVYK